MDDAKREELAANGCDDVAAKKTRRQFPVDLPLDVVLGKMPQKVNCKVMLLPGMFLLPGTPEREAGGSRRPSCLSVGGAGGAKVPFLNAMICFLIVNMIQRRSYKLKASNV